MLLLTEKLLIISMRLEKSDRKVVKFFGKLLGILPIYYSKWMAKRLFEGKYDPAKRYRKRSRKRRK